jgi:propanol-preferring alcohol dehydrogenase
MSNVAKEAIPKRARGAFVQQVNGNVKIEDYDVVQPKDLKPGEALVKVLYSGVCHTDLHAAKGDWPLESKDHLCGGHEGAGTIVAIGEHSNTNLKVGDNVGIKWLADSCMDCEFCRKGLESLCPQGKLSGFTVDGSFQQYAVSFTNHLTPIPENMKLDDAAPILCAGVTVYKALKQSNTKAGQWIAIPGAGGGLGHLCVQYANLMGMRVIAVDTGSAKKDLCMELGAEVWIDFKEAKDIVSAIKNATGDGFGPHGAIVTSASASGYEQALDYIRPGGTVVAVGLPAGAFVKSEVFFHVLYERKLVGSYVGNRQDAIEALELANLPSGKVKCHYVTKPLDDLPSIYEDMAAGRMAGRTVLKLF